MKQSAANFSLLINSLYIKVEDLEKRAALMEERMEYMVEAVDNLKEIVEQALLKANPTFKRVKTMKDVGNFLENRIGRTRLTKPDQG
jgi:hypothetical protein